MYMYITSITHSLHTTFKEMNQKKKKLHIKSPLKIIIISYPMLEEMRILMLQLDVVEKAELVLERISSILTTRSLSLIVDVVVGAFPIQI